MSLTAIPTQTAADRPPILPPVRTTFDGSADGGDSLFARLENGVRHLVRHADATEGEGLQTMIELLEMRKRMISKEIMAEMAFDDLSLPPFDELDDLAFLFLSGREERMLQGLIDDLDFCRQRCERRLARHRLQMRLLRDLGASDS